MKIVLVLAAGVVLAIGAVFVIGWAAATAALWFCDDE